MTAVAPFAAVTILASSVSLGASPFTGRWVADLDSQAGLGRDVYIVQGGRYSCESCNPPRHYAADGRYHRIIGDPEITAEAVTITGPRTMVTRLLEPTMTRTTTMTVSRDGKDATYVSIDHRKGIKPPLKTVYLARRIGRKPTGAHAVSGTWQGVAYESVPELVRSTDLRVTNSSFSYSVPIGVRYTASFSGAMAPVTGANSSGMWASVKRDGDRKIIETRTRNDKTILVRTFSLSMDGKALTITSAYPETGSSFSIIAHRKSWQRSQ